MKVQPGGCSPASTGASSPSTSCRIPACASCRKAMLALSRRARGPLLVFALTRALVVLEPERPRSAPAGPRRSRGGAPPAWSSARHDLLVAAAKLVAGRAERLFARRRARQTDPSASACSSRARRSCSPAARWASDSRVANVLGGLRLALSERPCAGDRRRGAWQLGGRHRGGRRAPARRARAGSPCAAACSRRAASAASSASAADRAAAARLLVLTLGLGSAPGDTDCFDRRRDRVDCR